MGKIPSTLRRYSDLSVEDLGYEDSLQMRMSDILEWVIFFLDKSSQATIREIYFNQKTVEKCSRNEFVTVFAVLQEVYRSAFGLTCEVAFYDGWAARGLTVGPGCGDAW